MMRPIKCLLIVAFAGLIIVTASCIRTPASPVKYFLANLSGNSTSIELLPGIRLELEGLENRGIVRYGIQKLSDTTVILLFDKIDLRSDGKAVVIDHEEFGLGSDQVAMVQPVMSEGAFYLSDGGNYGLSFSRDSLQTAVKFTQFPYCLLISKADALYFAQHLPGRYLLEGDLLYHIGPNWIPSHSAVYLGVDRETAMSMENLGYNNEISFGESYPFQTHGFNVIEEGVFVFPNNLDETKYVNLFSVDTYESRWLNLWATAFSGARRYNGTLTPEQRRGVSRFIYSLVDDGALWSVGLAWSGYRNIPFTRRDLYSCVGLVEKAYESVGANIVPFWDDWFYLNSFEEFSRTIPVPEITDYVGSRIEFRINALLANWKYVGSSKWEYLDHAWVWRSTNGVELVNSVGTLIEKTDYSIYSWTPDSPGLYDIVFRFYGLFEGQPVEKFHTLRIKVLQKS